MLANSYYGGYRTRTFSEIYDDVNEFVLDYNTVFPSTMKDADLRTLYYLLVARYANSHIANTDENQFKFKMAATIFQYGPTWARKLEMQATLRDMPESELLLGSKAIYNHSNNPSTAPSTDSLEELITIDDQNTTTYKKSKLEAYSMLWNMLVSDVTGAFLNKFKTLFIVITQPDWPLLYVEDEDEEEED